MKLPHIRGGDHEIVRATASVMAGCTLLAITALFPSGSFAQLAPPCVSPPEGLVSWWPADGVPDDIQGTNHGMLLNGVTFGGGKVGQAFHFDGNDDICRIPNSPSLQPASITIEAWLKGTSPNP